MNKTLSAVIHREENLFVAFCPEVGTASQGTSYDEALANLREATELYLEEFPQEYPDRAVFTTFELAG